MRRALLVGIDAYSDAPLAGCVADAQAMNDLLARNEDGAVDFDCILLTSPPESIDRPTLREAIQRLFRDEAEVALFYFSGHGTENDLGGYLVTEDAAAYDEGVALTEVLTWANNSKAHEVVVVLDSCHSGALGTVPAVSQNVVANLREGVSILTASRSTQAAIEAGGRGLFTSLVCGALDGGAADVIGHVTVAAIYAYVDQALGAWDQRPLLKSHVSTLVPLRTCQPAVGLATLRQLTEWFPAPDADFPLDPSFEFTVDPRDTEHERIFGCLQKCRDAKLLVPVDEEHLYFAAMNSTACRLTALGRYYWVLVNEGRI